MRSRASRRVVMARRLRPPSWVWRLEGEKRVGVLVMAALSGVFARVDARCERREVGKPERCVRLWGLDAGDEGDGYPGSVRWKRDVERT